MKYKVSTVCSKQELYDLIDYACRHGITLSVEDALPWPDGKAHIPVNKPEDRAGCSGFRNELVPRLGTMAADKYFADSEYCSRIRGQFPSYTSSMTDKEILEKWPPDKSADWIKLFLGLPTAAMVGIDKAATKKRTVAEIYKNLGKARRKK